MATYSVDAINKQGASTTVTTGESSVSAAAAEARRQMGSGWKIIIREEQTGREVKSFTIR